MARPSRTPKVSSGLGHIPRRDVGSWCQEVIGRCNVSRYGRILMCETMRNFYFTGTADGTAGVDNEILPEVDHLASSLFSPVEPRFAIGFDRNETPENRVMGETAAAYLSRGFQRQGVDQTFADAVNWGLIEASCFVKLLWSRQGFDPYLVGQTFMGVYQEGLSDLDRQDAFVHTTFVTLASLERALGDHPEGDAILRRVRRASRSPADEPEGPSGLRRLLIGGTIPVNLTPPQTSIPAGWVNWIRGPQAVLPTETLAELVQIDELWVIDNEREDYTTFQLAGDVVIEGKLQRRNLCGVKGHHPFTQVTPNPVKDYFWGRSEIANLMMPQEAVSSQVNGISRTMRMQENPPTSYQGLSGNIDERHSALMKPGGRIAEMSPTFKIDQHAPKLPEQAIPWLDKLYDVFHRSSGFEAPVSRGLGDQGLRSGIHAETAVRMSAPRIRDRAILIESRYAALGDLGFLILQAKIPDRFEVHTKVDGHLTSVAFILDQIPDDYTISVDSHSASPAFAGDAKRLAFDLARLRAINDIDLLRLTHPPNEDTLIANAEERHREQAAFMASHPELLRRSGHR